MLHKLRKALFGEPSKPVEDVQHERLGLLRADEDVWRASVRVKDLQFEFELGGNETPDEALVLHAVEVLDDYDSFDALVRDFLTSEASRKPDFADEIAMLRVESICIWWPDRPDDGMIYFTGNDSLRLWRCDYLARRPVGLGFDS